MQLCLGYCWGKDLTVGWRDFPYTALYDTRGRQDIHYHSTSRQLSLMYTTEHYWDLVLIVSARPGRQKQIHGPILHSEFLRKGLWRVQFGFMCFFRRLKSSFSPHGLKLVLDPVSFVRGRNWQEAGFLGLNTLLMSRRNSHCSLEPRDIWFQRSVNMMILDRAHTPFRMGCYNL